MHPKIAVIDPNTLAMLGMKQLLAQVMPFAVVDGFLSSTNCRLTNLNNITITSLHRASSSPTAMTSRRSYTRPSY